VCARAIFYARWIAVEAACDPWKEAAAPKTVNQFVSTVQAEA